MTTARTAILPEIPYSEARLFLRHPPRHHTPEEDEIAEAVGRIVREVRSDGDAAVRRLTYRFDGVDVEQLRVPSEEIENAHRMVDRELLKALREAARRIRIFHERELAGGDEAVETGTGVRSWRVWRPVDRVGLYVPGGRASYPSTVLMLGIPAAIAGCPERALATPPGPEGTIPPGILAAAAEAGLTEIYRCGGAQAVAALAYGTETIKPVEKIFGPGNAYVVEAKIQVSRDVAIDLPAGPSELMIVADGSTPPDWVAADLLANSEHAPDSPAILLALSRHVVDQVRAALTARLSMLPRREIAAAALASHGAAVVVEGVRSALELVNAYAPEHLQLMVDDPHCALAGVRNAGSVFLGSMSPNAAGDYAVGTNHVLPTGGFARSYQALSVEAFGRRMQVQELDREGLQHLKPSIVSLARSEGFEGHARAVEGRTGQLESTTPPLEASAIGSETDAPSIPGLRVRSDFPDVKRYRAVKTLEDLSAEHGISVDRWVKLNQNENPYGPPPQAREALSGVIPHRYPDSTSTPLREALARCYGLAPDRIVTGVGGDEVIDLLLRLFIDPGDELITCPPTFGFYAVTAGLNRGRLIDVPRDDQFAVDAAAIEQAVTHRTKLILLCSPNNPTGNLTPDATVEQVLGLGVPLLLDEAYVEFAGGSGSLALQERYPHLMIVRTFSKWAGLAGLRVGYGIFSSPVAPLVASLKPAYTVGAASEAAALISLARRDELLATVDRIRTSARALVKDLARFGFLRVFPTDANFVYCRTSAGCDPGWLHDQLLRRGIIVRLFQEPDAIRITAGTEEDNRRLVVALEEIDTLLGNGS